AKMFPMIIVTGGAGFIGSVLAAKLNELGERALLIVDQKARKSPKWENIEKRYFQDYLESDEFIDRLEKGEWNGKIKAVFHMGACTDTTERDESYLRQNNFEYTRRLAEWVIANKVYFSYASSAATYGAGELGFSDDDAKTPRLKPLNPYGQSKLDFDIWALKNGLGNKITGFRFFNVYGPNEYHKGEMRSLVHKGFGQIRDTGKMRLFRSYKKEYPDGGQKRDFIYVKDAVDTLVWFFKNPKWKGVYNLGTGRAQTWNDLAKALFKAMGRAENIEYIEMPDSIKNQYQYFTQSDPAKLLKTGCPDSFRDLEAGVSDYIRNYLLKENPYL
ncbi:MAG: ADP-glyceromanno-heptose 6-epimerase, partial [Candidatus Omnitrophota bacterium]